FKTFYLAYIFSVTRKKNVLVLFLLKSAITPQVQVYSRDPGEFGNDNVLICHVSNFHPPDITIEILKDEEVIPGAVQTDLTFKQDWHFHLTKSVEFKPSSGEKYKCRVTHGTNRKDYIWEPNM
uniref:Beta-2-microglobulin n=1 Tax=Nothobranchius furzeri TaxID=105023 RepID=A0A8C6NJF7_NOTFU